VDDAEQVFKSLAVQTSATAHALAEAALQHWRQSSSAAENPLAASIIRSCTGAKGECLSFFQIREFYLQLFPLEPALSELLTPMRLKGQGALKQYLEPPRKGRQYLAHL
jgi:hypothetical protein